MRFSIATYIGIIICILGAVLLSGSTSIARASNTTGPQRGSVFITAFSSGEAGCATCEFIEITNTSSQAVDVTGWRLEYRAADADSSVYRLKTLAADPSVRLMLPAGAREALLDSKRAQAGMLTFTPRLADKGGALMVRDQTGALVDLVGWGSSAHALDAPARKSDSGWYVRSGFAGNNQQDFAAVEAGSYPLIYGALQEVVDVCNNLSGIQVEPPVGMIRQADGSCVTVDQCPNLSGIQEAVPPGYTLQNGSCLPRQLPSLRINEVFANPAGVDTGVEYVELYNPTSTTVNLQDYTLLINGKLFSLPDSRLAPGAFFVTTSAPLLNGGGTITLRDALTEASISSTTYPAAKDDVAWAFDEAASDWRTTTQATPGAVNVFPVVVVVQDDEPDASTLTPCRADQYRNPTTNRCKKRETPTSRAACGDGKVRNPATNRCRNVVTAQSALKPCATDQYRSPATNRCRKLTTTGTTLTPCRADQYRNPATNRCRNLASAASTLKPCQAGQTRNPATNRCRKVSASSGVKPCQPGQERNPATNRCRKVSGTATLTASGDFPVESMATSANTMLGWWIAGGIGVAGSAVIAWSRRDQFLRLFRRVRPEE